MNNILPAGDSFPYYWKERKILIAEDIDFSFLYIEAVLRRTGAKVLWAKNGMEAIELVKVNNDIDVVLMDIHMPLMNGYDATREILKIQPELPVIAQTAFVMPTDIKECFAAGCTGYLAKPIKRAQLIQTLSDIFERNDQLSLGHSHQRPEYWYKIS